MSKKRYEKNTLPIWGYVITAGVLLAMTVLFWLVGADTERDRLFLILFRIFFTALTFITVTVMPYACVITPETVKILYLFGLLSDFFDWKDVRAVRTESFGKIWRFHSYDFEVSSQRPPRFFFMQRRLLRSRRLRHLVLRYWGKPENE